MPVLFCGECVSDAGPHLVRVIFTDKSHISLKNTQCIVCSIEVYEPATMVSPLKLASAGSVSLGSYPIEPMQVLRVFAGQVDKKDRSRFTLRYQLGTAEGEIVGRMNGRVVELFVKNGPLMDEPKE